MRFPATLGWVSLPVVVGVLRHSWLRAPGAVPRQSWLGSAGGGGVWSLATPGCGCWLRFSATPGWGLPSAVVLGGPSPLLAEGPVSVFLRHSRPWVSGAVPRLSWLGSAGCGGGCFRGVGWGVSRVVCACGAAPARGVCAGVCGLCSWCLCWWWCGCGCAFRVCLCVCVCVCVCACVVCWWRVVVVPCFPRLGLFLALVGMGLVCAVVGPSPLLAEVPVCDSPPLLAGFCCRWWWVFLATPG